MLQKIKGINYHRPTPIGTYRDQSKESGVVDPDCKRGQSPSKKNASVDKEFSNCATVVQW